MNLLLHMEGITKQYPGVRALDAVTFELQAGEVHCLVGENGAGKSTLMKVLAGAVPKDAGRILIEGVEGKLDSPAVAQQLGIAVIYQDFKLVNELSVAENILLGQEPVKGPLRIIDRQKLRERARAVLAQLGEEIDTHERVGSLSVAQRQIVEIAKALTRKVRILVMDEPTATLSRHEIDNLFQVIRRLKGEGVGIIYISHRLDEIFEIGDRVTILRDGKQVQTAPVKDVDRRRLIQWMVGRELEQEFPKVQLPRGSELLRVENLSTGRLRDISLTVHRGEIVGLAGLVGAGRTELAYALFGVGRKEAGSIRLDGQEYTPLSPRQAIEQGVGLLTEDRNRYGLVLQMKVRENISLSNLDSLVKGIRIDRSAERKVAGGFIQQLRLKTPSSEVGVETLSGGNRQKVVLARWLYTKSKLLIFDEPTSGIDVGAKYEIYLLMNDLAKQGIGVLMISSDLPELLGMCDRIAVMCNGRITGILSREEATQERVLVLATQFGVKPASVR